MEQNETELYCKQRTVKLITELNAE